MIVYQNTKSGFLDDVLTNDISNIIHAAYFEKIGRYTSKNEVLSWTNSMMRMNTILVDEEIPNDAGISIEFHIPLTSKRIDFIISGADEQNKDHVIIIELKQWSSADITEKDAVVKTRFEHGVTETPHPSYQAWSYASILNNFNSSISDENISLIPCAYLHNYTPDNVISNSFYQEYISKAPLFLKPDAVKLRDFIKRFIKYGDKKDILYKIENGRLRPSKQLADSLASMLTGNQEFIMLDDQKIVYETALSFANKGKLDRKHILIVEGGPGTGKSVVAINLLVELTNRGMLTRYVSKNSAPRAVYSTKLSGVKKKTEISNLFGGSGAFIDVAENTFDVLIVDEAHRLNLKSGLYQNQGENQISEIINAAKVIVFFVDDNQKIHINDIGSISNLEKLAQASKAIVKRLELSSQFRCNGSDGYLAWLDNTLQIKETANIKLTQDEFDFQVIETPNELYRLISDKNKVNNKSRVVAGYCWDWASKNDKTQADIIIPEYNFKMKWNLSEDGGLWIIQPESINQIGCIHTCQSLELDYVGVIIGNDLRFEDSRIVTDVMERSSNDNSIKGIKKKIREDKSAGLQLADSIIKNTYRTLMTRGMKGCYVYCCNEKLAQYIKTRFEFNVADNIQDVKPKTDTFRIEFDVNEDVKYIDFLPVYTLKAACGAFGEWQVVDELGWVKVDGVGKLNRSMFVIQAIGKSMEPLIMDGDYCIFRANVVGSRNSKTVLAQHYNHYDSDNQGSYSIKKYTSDKVFDKETGEWQHERITLKPINPSYDDICLKQDDEFNVIGEFLGVIN